MRNIYINTGAGYDVIENSGHPSDAGAVIREHFPKAERALIITDNNLHTKTPYPEQILSSVEKAGLKAHLFSLLLDENNKSYKSVEALYELAALHGIHRNDVFISVGGGIVCDITGYAAATYMRGTGLCHIPTTIVAQADASIGGKCGYNLGYRKNRIGTFYDPGLVYIDTDYLKTLPGREISGGMAEIIKYAAIADSELFDILNKGTFDMSDVIMRCIEIKARTVEQDRLDVGKRHSLNFGHTPGHAIEDISKHKYIHGEAVAIGMYKMAAAGEKLGITEVGTAEKIKLLCEKYDLNVIYRGRKYAELIGEDKKSTGDSIKAVFLTRIGESVVKEMSVPQLRELLI